MFFTSRTKLPSDGPPADNRKRAGMAPGLPPPPPPAGGTGEPLSALDPSRTGGERSSALSVFLLAAAAPLWAGSQTQNVSLSGQKGGQRCQTGTRVHSVLVQVVTSHGTGLGLTDALHAPTLRVAAATGGVSDQPPGCRKQKVCSGEGDSSPLIQHFLIIYFVPGLGLTAVKKQSVSLFWTLG